MGNRMLVVLGPSLVEDRDHPSVHPQGGEVMDKEDCLEDLDQEDYR
jgi:hypothetical protein